MRVNSHAHVFNLDSVLSQATLEIVRKRVIAEVKATGILNEKLRRELSEQIADLLARSLEDHPRVSDEKFLRALLDELDERTGLVSEARDALGSLPSPFDRLVGAPLEQLVVLELRGLVSRLTGLLRRRDDLRGSFVDLVDFLLIAFQSELAAVAARLLDQIGPEDAAVALMMDIGPASGNAAALAADLRLYERHRDRTAAAMLAHPGRILPFVGVHPGRGGSQGTPDFFELMRDALENRGFVGVKIYPALGYSPDTDELDRVYDYCSAHGVPVLTHNSRGGFFASQASRRLSDPGLFGPVLDRHPALKLCLAHFGGTGGLSRIELDPAARDPQSWGDRILGLMDRHEGVFTDISFHTEPLESSQHETAYFAKLKALLADSRYRDRILFGTDYWLVRTQLTEARHWRYFEDQLTVAEFARIAETNPRAFLGLPDALGRGASESIDRMIDRIIAESASIENRPAEWLLGGLEARDAAAFARLSALRRRAEPSPRLRIPDWDAAIAALADRSLAEAAADGAPLAEWQPDAATFDLAGIALELRAETSLAVRLFNEASVVDPDGVVGRIVGTEESDFATRAWLGYRLEGSLQLEGETTFEPRALGLGFEAGASIVLTDYRQHLRNRETTRAAVRSDLRRPRFAFRRGDVVRLEVDDALSLRVAGTLSGRVELSWSTALAGNLNRLGRSLGIDQPIDIQIGLGASVSGGLGVTDDFRLVFARPRGNPASLPYKVSVRRAKTRTQSFAIEANLGVRFADPEVIEAILSGALDERLGDVEELLGKAVAERTEDDKELLERLVERLGLESRALSKIRERIARLEEDARKAVEAIARAELTVGFGFEYGRLEENGVLLEANLTAGLLSELHSDLVRGDFAALLERIEGEPDRVELVSFLHEEILTRRRSWGFSLGLLSRFGTFRDFMLERIHTQDRLVAAGEPAEQRITYIGRRGYEGKNQSGEQLSGWTWSGELTADTGDFKPMPTTRDFRYALELRFEWRKTMGKKLADRILDSAVLWGALSSPDNARETLAGLVGKRPTVQLLLRVRHQPLRQILRLAGSLDAELMALALAASMPFNRLKRDPVRRSVELRRSVYAGLFKLYLSDQRDGVERSTEDYGQLARRHFVRVGEELGLDLREAGGAEELAAGRPLWTFAGMVGKLPDLFEDLQRVGSGLERLRDAVHPVGFGGVQGKGVETLEEIYDDLRPGWSQSLLIRAFGRYLLEAADLLAGTPALVESSLTVEHGGGFRLVGVPTPGEPPPSRTVVAAAASDE